MIKPNESGTMYDFVGSNHEATVTETAKKVREVNWQSSDNFKREEALKQKHAKEAMTTDQPDNSKMAWWRLFTGQIPKCSFERDVNSKFGGKPQGEFNYTEKQAQYISFYKQAMEDL